MLGPRRPSRRLALSLFLALVFFTCLSRVASLDHTNRLVVDVGLGTFRSPSYLSSPLPDDDSTDQNQDPGPVSVRGQFGSVISILKATNLQLQTKYGLENVSPLPHRVLFSTSTKNREFMRVYLGGIQANNINIIPHPTKADFWILVAQRHQLYTPLNLKQTFTGFDKGAQLPAASEQVSCSAGIQNDNVICAEPATTVPFPGPQLDGVCLDQLAFLTLVWGWRDSRVFMGPELPYMTYGAKATSICFGQWLQDARNVLPQLEAHRHIAKDKSSITSAVELTRSFGARAMEKNYFLFWDADNTSYVHYTLWPQRALSRLHDDGTASQDQASLIEYHDQICMARFMPPVKKDSSSTEAIHQATNSLAITMCKRSDRLCQPDDSNTFIMHVFHHKTYTQGHAVYEPYVILFQRHSPFAIHAIGQRPYWIYGRRNFTETTESLHFQDSSIPRPEGHTEMFYITSMNWKSHTQRYHGYMDDVLFLSFGIEDIKPGIIDIVAGDLFDDLAYC